MSGASSPSCARIHTQYKLGRGTEFLGFFLKPNMIPSFQKLQTRFRLAWETILQLSLSWAGNTKFASLDSRSRLCARRTASAARTRHRASERKAISEGYAMLAGRGRPGGFVGPEVPVLEPTVPWVPYSFRAFVLRSKILIPYPHRVVKRKCLIYREKSWT